MEGITNYVINRQTDGFNDKIKVIKRRCYGILNVKHLFQHIYLDHEGYSLFDCFIKEICSTRITKEPNFFLCLNEGGGIRCFLHFVTKTIDL